MVVDAEMDLSVLMEFVKSAISTFVQGVQLIKIHAKYAQVMQIL